MSMVTFITINCSVLEEEQDSWKNCWFWLIAQVQNWITPFDALKRLEQETVDISNSASKPVYTSLTPFAEPNKVISLLLVPHIVQNHCKKMKNRFSLKLRMMKKRF